MRFHRKNLIMTAAFAIATVMLGVTAWRGDKFSVVMLCVFAIAIVIIQQLGTALIDDLLADSRETTSFWKSEITYAQRVTHDHVQVIKLLDEHDPSAAALFQERLAEALIARSPEWAQSTAEQAAHGAETN